MARIRTVRTGDITRVIVRGRLTAADMGRFEHACAPGLVVDPSPLELDLRAVIAADRSAAAVVRRLAARGARIRGGTALLES